MSFQVFLSISLHNLLLAPCTTCFLLLVMGLSPRFYVFSSYGSPSSVLRFWVWFFVRTLVLSFFSSLVSLRGVFPLFIYLFIYSPFNLSSPLIYNSCSKYNGPFTLEVGAQKNLRPTMKHFLTCCLAPKLRINANWLPKCDGMHFFF